MRDAPCAVPEKVLNKLRKIFYDLDFECVVRAACVACVAAR